MPNVTKYSLENMKGKKYGKLTVVGPEEVERKESTGKLIRYVWCKCDCGKMYRGIISEIGSGRTISCGCYIKENSIGKRRQRGEFTSSGHTTHGLSHTRLHSIWCNMKTRCYNSHADNYRWYGMNNIEVCDEWKNSFESFYNWAMSNGYRDDLELDRINSIRDYKPSNCRWVTRKDQTSNMSSNRYLMYNGKQYSIAQCAEMIGCNYNSLTSFTRNHRLFNSLEEVIENANFIGYHIEDKSTDALIFIDESKADYSNYHLDYSHKPKQDTPIIQPPKKNYFMR